MSGSDLIGPVPTHWKLKPLRLLGRLLKGTGGSKEDAVEEGVPCVRYGELYSTHRNFIEHARSCVTQERAADYTPIEYGDVLFAASGETIEEIGKSAVNLLQGARCGGDVVILRPTAPFVPRFLGYATDAAPVAAQKSMAGRGSTVKHIYPDEIRKVVIAVPPIEEQQDIADFLDRETTRLDALVAEKQRLLGLLSEKRKAIIATRVTRGLDANVKLRDSGVPWLGEIPAHWKHRNLRFCCTAIQTGGTPAPEFLDYDGDDGLDWLTPGDFSELLVPQRSLRRVAPGALSAGDLKMFPAGTVLVVGIGATLGKVGMPSHPASANQQVNALIPRDDIDSSFLAYEMLVLAELLRVSANTATLPILNQQRMGDVPVLVPPLGEQQVIVEHVGRETAKLDAVRVATDRTIALLKERRTALIAAAVTGQIDLRAAA